MDHLSGSIRADGMNLRLGMRLFILLLLIATPLVSLEPQEVDRLTLDRSITRRLQAGDVHRFDIEAASDQFVQVAVDEISIDVRLTLLGPDGVVLLETAAPNNVLDPEQLIWTAAASGRHRIEIRSFAPGVESGSYAVRLLELRAATEADPRRIAAVRSLREADLLRAEGSASSNRSSLAKYEEALGGFRSLGDRSREASALFGVGKCRDSLGERRPALEAFGAALGILREARDTRGEGVLLNEIGLLHYSLGEPRRALDLYDQALPLHRSAENRRGEAVALNNIGLAHASFGDWEKALDFYLRSLSLNRAANFRRGEAVNLINLGSAYDALGDKPKAISVFEQSLPISRSLGERGREANTLNNLGAVYLSVGESQKALDHYRRAVALWRAVGDRPGEAATLHNIAHVFSLLGDPEKAIDHYNRALPVLRAVGNKAGEATTLNNIARVHAAAGERTQALEFYNQALVILRALNNRAVEAQTLTNIGSLYFSQGDAKKALELYQEALPIQRTVRSRSGEAQTLSRMGVVYHSVRDLEQAVGLQLQALKLFESVGDRRGEASSLYHLARAEYTRGKLDDAHSRIRAAVGIVESLRGNVASQQLRASFLASVQNFYESHIEILMALHGERPAGGFASAALEVSERARARSLLETLAEARADVRSGVDPELLGRERSLESRLNTAAQRRMQLLARAHTEEQARAADQEIARIAADSDEVRAQIRSRSPRYAALTQPVPLSVGDLQSKVLDSDTTLLEFSLGEDRSFVWAVSPSSLDCFELPARERIEAAARRFYQAVREEQESWHEASLELGRMILGPVAGRIRTNRLVIVSGGALQYVPFAAVAHPAAELYRPLIRDYEIVHLPSASALAVLRQETAGRSAPPKTVAVIADPVFQSDDSRVKAKTRPNSGPSMRTETSGQRSGEPETLFGRLLGTRREADAILALAPAGSRRRAVDFEASRALVTGGELADYRMVHFATHGVLDSERPELSGVVLSLVDEKGDPSDGILRLHQIFNLKLPVELVVLSACRTALGKEIKGEGLVGLTRGFMYAGAPRVVASLWKVDDRATSALMKNFYRAMLGAGRLRPAAALRTAQTSVLKERQWEHPYYWSAFVIQGEWR